MLKKFTKKIRRSFDSISLPIHAGEDNYDINIFNNQDNIINEDVDTIIRSYTTSENAKTITCIECLKSNLVEPLMLFSCNHIFHINCLNIKTLDCPFCKKPISENDLHSFYNKYLMLLTNELEDININLSNREKELKLLQKEMVRCYTLQSNKQNEITNIKQRNALIKHDLF